MRLPIPDDWDGEAWSCYRVEWPDSPLWTAVLAGLLSLSSRGRVWDERSGSILDVQEIGREIWSKNYPLVDCFGDDVIVETRFVYRIMSSLDRSLSEEFVMSLCGYNPKAFDIRGGKLYVRDFCGEWVEIGSLSSQPDVPTDDIIPDPPVGGYEDSTACAMASKLAVFVYNVVVQAWVQIGTPELVDIYDYVSDMRDHFPGVDLAYNDLLNMYFNIIPLDAAGYENECRDVGIVQYLKCAWEPLIPPGNTGISSQTYDALIDAATGALQQAVGDSALLGFGRTIRYVWEFALKSIGSGDAQEITYYAQPTGLEDCSCPGVSDESPVSQNGWYWSASKDYGFTYPDNFGTGYINAQIVGEHDVYGVAIQIQSLSSPDDLNKYKRDNSPQATYDVWMFGVNSDAWSGTKYDWQVQVDPDIEVEVLDLLNGASHNRSPQFASTDVINTPSALSSEVALATYAFGSASGTHTGTAKVRWLHNVNSPSHG